MIYTGIGSQDTPPDRLQQMFAVAKFLGNTGHTLRSGGAKGADSSFERGCDSVGGDKEIYLPYSGFNGKESPFNTVKVEARMMAKLFHPNWEYVGPRGRDYMGRNAYQVLGLDLKTPTDFIICWTPGGRVTGGTGQALRMALHYEIPVFNFGSMSLDDMDAAIKNLF